jgi:hypothetical protein
MQILRKNIDQKILINGEQDFKLDLGWQDNMAEFENEVLRDIINPTENLETVRFIHNTYTSSTTGIEQTDIWFNFYFIDAASGYTNGLDYNLVDITINENIKMLKQSTESFFRLEFYKTPGTVVNNVLTCEKPNRTNRRLVFAKNLSLPLGEKYFYTGQNLFDYIFVPVFMGSNYRNKENMYFFWFDDETVLEETNLSGSTTGNTFFMSAKFFNAKDASILDFTTTGLTSSQQVVEFRDMYYQIDINKVNKTYEVYRYDGTKLTRIGKRGDPINFYERRG